MSNQSVLQEQFDEAMDELEHYCPNARRIFKIARLAEKVAITSQSLTGDISYGLFQQALAEDYHDALLVGHFSSKQKYQGQNPKLEQKEPLR